MEIKLPKSIKQNSSEDSPWLLAYSDMVTLLLAFFVLFFAISQMDMGKFEMIMEYFSENNKSMPLPVLEEKLKALVEEHQLEQSVEVELRPDGVMVNFQDNILFDSGRAELKDKSLPILSALAEVLNAADVIERRIEVQGHTDSVPLSENALYPSNWELSTARSSSVIRQLLDTHVDSRRFVAVGYADTRPKEQETLEHRGLPVNRRVSLLIN